MTREEQLVFCKKCKHGTINFKRGLLCGLTNELATFETSCPDFVEVEKVEESKVYTLNKSKGPYVASQGKRFVNYVIDRLFIMGMGGVFGVALGAIWMYFSPDNFLELELLFDTRIVQYVVGAILGIIYYSFFEGVTGRSIGKYFTKTKVVDENGQKPTVQAIFLRSLCRFIPFEALSFLGSEPIGWHDSLSKTRVVDIED